MDEIKWKTMDRDLDKDDIIRVQVQGRYLYGRFIGGFGGNIDSPGGKIFVDNESWEFEETEKRTSETMGTWRGPRGIEIVDKGE